MPPPPFKHSSQPLREARKVVTKRLCLTLDIFLAISTAVEAQERDEQEEQEREGDRADNRMEMPNLNACTQS